MPHKEIICADAIDWMQQNTCGAIVTSPPDAEEIGLPLADWREWFINAARLCFKASGGPVVFYVTDRKHGGETWSKPKAIFEASGGASLAWHKIALRRDVGAVDIHRPGFSHLLAFNGKPGTATPDTIRRGNVLYPNGTGILAARVAVEWAMKASDEIVDPFCGQGTIPAVAEALGAKAIGVDIDEAQCEKARACVLRAR